MVNESNMATVPNGIVYKRYIEKQHPTQARAPARAASKLSYGEHHIVPSWLERNLVQYSYTTSVTTIYSRWVLSKFNHI